MSDKLRKMSSFLLDKDHDKRSKSKVFEMDRKSGLNNGRDKLIEQEEEVIQQCLNEFRNKYPIEEGEEYNMDDMDKLMRDMYKQCEVEAGITSLIQNEDTATIRKKEQIQQQRAWLIQQEIEHKEQKELKKIADELFLDTIKEREARDAEIESIKAEIRKRETKALYDFNKAMAREKKIRDEMERMRCLEDSFLNTPFKENLDITSSNSETGKKNGAGETQLEQMKVKKETDDRLNAEWEELVCQFKRLHPEDKIIERKLEENHKQLNELSNALGREQRQHQDYLKKAAHTNVSKSKCYTQLNKSHQ